MALPVGVDLYVNENRILEPLNLVVLKDSRLDLLPSVKSITEEIPGKHGDIFLDSKLRPRILELKVAVSEEFSFEERESKKKKIANYLDPTKGTKVLVFADDQEKQYFVKYSGTIDMTQYPSWLEFMVTFKCSDPYIYSELKEEEKYSEELPVAINLASNGSLNTFPVVILENEGTNTINGFAIRQYLEIE